MSDPDLITRLEGRGAWVKVYQRRVADAVEWLVKAVHDGPISNPEGVERTYWDGVTDASDGLQWELRQLFWEEIKIAVVSWQPATGAPSYSDLRAALDRANAIIGQQADEAKALQDRLDEVLGAVWSYTELDVEHMISCHADSLPEAYRRACAALDAAKAAGTPDLG